MGVNRLVALRGDIPSGPGLTPKPCATRRSWCGIIREHFGSELRIEVGCYPEIHPDAPSPDADIAFLKRKVDAGAE